MHIGEEKTVTKAHTPDGQGFQRFLQRCCSTQKFLACQHGMSNLSITASLKWHSGQQEHAPFHAPQAQGFSNQEVHRVCNIQTPVQTTLRGDNGDMKYDMR